MRDSSRLVLWIATVAVIIVVAVFAVFAISASTDTGSGAKLKYECTIKISDDLISKARITQTQCINIGKCGLLGAVNIPWAYDTEGDVEIYDAVTKELVSSKSFDTGILSLSDTVTLEGCSSNGAFIIRVYDEDHNLLDEKNTGDK